MYKIKQLREKHKMTQEDLASKSGVSRSLIAQLESGRLQSTSTNTLKKIAQSFNCKITDLFLNK